MATTIKRQEKPFFENLDGLRFFSFLSVFLFHSFHTEYKLLKEFPLYNFIAKDLFGNGNLGVNFFFVLSGFLITYLLIDEKNKNGKISVGRFWIRRILRIWPLYFFCTIYGFFLFPQLKIMLGQTPNETAELWRYLTFTSNFDIIINGLPDASVLGVLWSVAIEEQFYFLWPVILLIVPVRKYWIPFLVVIISSITYRAFHNSGLEREMHSLSCIGDMAVGSFGAWAIYFLPKLKNTISQLKSPFIVAIYLLTLLTFIFRDELISQSIYIGILDRTIVAILFLIIILEQNYCRNSLFKLSNFKVITYLGRLTYGLYCLHFIGITATLQITKMLSLNTQLWQVLLLETTIALILTIALSYLSYKYFESPFLKLKEKFTYLVK